MMVAYSAEMASAQQIWPIGSTTEMCSSKYPPLPVQGYFANFIVQFLSSIIQEKPFTSPTASRIAHQSSASLAIVAPSASLAASLTRAFVPPFTLIALAGGTGFSIFKSWYIGTVCAFGFVYVFYVA